MTYIRISTHSSTARNEADRIEGAVLHVDSDERVSVHGNTILITNIVSIARAAKMCADMEADGYIFNAVEINGSIGA